MLLQKFISTQNVSREQFRNSSRLLQSWQAICQKLKQRRQGMNGVFDNCDCNIVFFGFHRVFLTAEYFTYTECLLFGALSHRLELSRTHYSGETQIGQIDLWNVLDNILYIHTTEKHIQTYVC